MFSLPMTTNQGKATGPHQHDNPTIGQEILSDWLADRFGIDQRKVLKTSYNPLI